MAIYGASEIQRRLKAQQPVRPATTSIRQAERAPAPSKSISTVRGPVNTASLARAATVPPALKAAKDAERSGGGGGGGGGSAPAPPRQEERYWWQPDWRDSAYNAQLAAVERALADYETELGLKGERYGTDYLRGVRELGFRPGEGFSANVDVRQLADVPATGARVAGGLSAVQRAMMPVATQGQWDYEGEFSPFSAAARGTRTARDEFAGRGTLRSSDFARAYADFQDRMQQQLTSMETGRARFFEDAAMDLAQQRASAEERRQAARLDAMARAASQGEFRTR